MKFCIDKGENKFYYTVDEFILNKNEFNIAEKKDRKEKEYEKNHKSCLGASHDDGTAGWLRGQQRYIRRRR